MVNFSKITALYGGSFDPVHNGHLHVAKECLRLVPEIEQIFFVPNFQNPDKNSCVASGRERLEFLTLALKNTPFQVWDYEINGEKPSYTINTLREAHRLGAKKERLFWILGADAYAGFPLWKNSAEIRTLCRLLVVARPHHTPLQQDPEDQFLSIKLHGASATDIRESFFRGEIPRNCFPFALEQHLQNLHLQGKNPYANFKK